MQANSSKGFWSPIFLIQININAMVYLKKKKEKILAHHHAMHVLHQRLMHVWMRGVPRTHVGYGCLSSTYVEKWTSHASIYLIWDRSKHACTCYHPDGDRNPKQQAHHHLGEYVNEGPSCGDRSNARQPTHVLQHMAFIIFHDQFCTAC